MNWLLIGLEVGLNSGEAPMIVAQLARGGPSPSWRDALALLLFLSITWCAFIADWLLPTMRSSVTTDSLNQPDRVAYFRMRSVRLLCLFGFLFTFTSGAYAMARWGSLLSVALLGAMILELAFYDRLKAVPLLKNLTVIVSGLTLCLYCFSLLDGDVARQLLHNRGGALIFMIARLVRWLGIEIFFDVIDLDGDRKSAIRTLPMAIGPKPALLLARALMALSAAVAWYLTRCTGILIIDLVEILWLSNFMRLPLLRPVRFGMAVAYVTGLAGSGL